MPIDVYDKPKFIETCEIDCGSLIHDEDLSLSLFQFSLSFQLFRMMKFYSFLVVLNMVEEASKKVYVSDIVVSVESIIIYLSFKGYFYSLGFQFLRKNFSSICTSPPFLSGLHILSSCTPLRWRYL